MGTIKISEFLFNIKGKVAKQHAEPIIEKNDFSDVQSLKRFKNSGQEITPYPVIGRSVSDVEQKLSS